MPKLKAAIEIRPPSNTFILCLNPAPTSPNLLASGMRQLSKIISAVSLALMPNLFSFFPPLKPGVPRSTINAVELSFALGSPVRQTTTAISPDLPWVIQHLVPFNTQWLPSFTAVVFILPASLPVLASVKPHAPKCSAVANLGKYFFFCSSLPKVKIWPVHNELCAASDNPIEPHTLAISCITTLYSK